MSIIVVVIAKSIVCAIAISHGWGGSVWHVGLTVQARALFGIWGSYIVVIQRVLLCIVWYATQSFTAGQCVTLVLSSLIPSFNSMKNTLPEHLHMSTKELIGFVIYHIISIPILCIAPEKLKYPLTIISTISAITIVAVSVACMVKARGVGILITASAMGSSSKTTLSWFRGINYIINSVAVGLTNQPDFSRFAVSPGKQVWGQIFSIIVLGTIVPVLGLLGTSAAINIYGNGSHLNLWNPTSIIEQWLVHSYSPGIRCAVFFCSLGFLISTIGLNTIDNGISGGMDMAGILPKYINIRRGAIIVALVSIIVQPWRILYRAKIFLNILSSYGIFLGPFLALFTCDYFIVRRQRLHLTSLYTSSSNSIYYYTHGFNLRAIIAWVLSFAPGISGIGAVHPENNVPVGAVRLFQLSFLIGYSIAFILYAAINKFFPPEGIGLVDEADEFGTFTEKEIIDLSKEISDSRDSTPKKQKYEC